ncbi:hypothetical protein PIB30_055619 [Stylosanthes scabra]|uniref:Uncharacterized protein n=1 Tax=Stylosanthes scabra TaxID=79078 RepID=A0ABU6ZHU3_9FABA|nr:hypothetical protein [Stylosanthes scabra]
MCGHITLVVTVEIDSVWSAMVWDTTIEPGSSFWEWFMVMNRLTLLEGLVRQPTKHRFYRAWVTVKPVGSAKSCRPKANLATKMLLRPTVQRNERLRAEAKKSRAQAQGNIPLVENES